MGSKSSSSTIGYWYKLKILFGLCQGPIDALLSIDADDANAWTGEVTSNQTITINAGELWGGEDEQGGIVGDMDIMLGGQDQAINTWLTTNLGSQHSAYRGLVTAAFKGGRWGAFNPYPKSPTFLVRRIYEGWLDDVCWYSAKAAIRLDGEDDPGIAAMALSGSAILSTSDATDWSGDPVGTVTAAIYIMAGSDRYVRWDSGAAKYTMDGAINWVDSAGSLGGVGGARRGCYFDGAFLISGGTNGIYASTDGADSFEMLLGTPTVNWMAASAERVIAFGHYSNSLQYSTDPLNNWTEGASFSGILVVGSGACIAAGDGEFRIGGKDSSENGVMLQTSTGEDIATLALPIFGAGAVLGICYGSGTWVAGDAAGHMFYDTGDGWVLSVDVMPAAIASMSWTGTMFLAVGSGFIAYSIGGQNWEIAREDSVNYSDVAAIVRSAQSALRGMNAAHILYDSITDPSMGAEPIEVINDASFRAAADVFYAEGMGLVPEYDPDSENIEDFQKRICDAAGGVLSKDPSTGQYMLEVPRGNYVLDDLPIITDDDILEWSEQPTTLDDAINQLYVKWYDPITDADGTTPPLQALGAIQAFGTVVTDTVDRSGEVATQQLAIDIGARNLRAGATPLRKFDWKTTTVFRSIRPGTYFRLQAPKRGIADMVCLMGEKKSGTLKSGAMTVSASEDVYSQPDTVYVSPTSPPETASKVPTVSAYQVALEAPYVLLIGRLSAADLAALADDAGYLMALSARPTVGQYFRLMAQTGGAEYSYQAQGDWCPSATLVEAMDYLTTAFTLAGASDLDQVVTGGLALVDGELCRVDAIDVDSGTVSLARGCADTTPAKRDSGARVYFLVNYASDSTEYVGGETVYAKLLTRGASAITALDTATALAVAMNDRQARPYPPGALTINGETYPAAAYVSMELTWAHRDRVGQSDQLLDTTAGNQGPEAGVTYTLRVYDTADETLLDEQTGITGTTATTAPSSNATARVEVWAVRDGMQSWQALSHVLVWSVSALANYADENDDTYADENGDTYQG